MQLIQIAKKVSRLVSLVGHIWKENQKLKSRLRIVEVDYEMLTDDLDRIARRLESLERTESRMRQVAIY